MNDAELDDIIGNLRSIPGTRGLPGADAIEKLIRERDEARANYQWMVEHAADQKLDGYRELGAKAAKAEEERDEARAWSKKWKERCTEFYQHFRMVQTIKHLLCEIGPTDPRFEKSEEMMNRSKVSDQLKGEIMKAFRVYGGVGMPEEALIRMCAEHAIGLLEFGLEALEATVEKDDAR